MNCTSNYFISGFAETIVLDMDSTPVISQGSGTINELAEYAGYKNVMLSGRFTLSTYRTGKLLDMDYVFSNELIIDDEHITGDITGLLTKQNPKGHVFGEVARQNGVKPDECVVICDGADNI
ncbi:MAG TPA: hypothetical protein C5S50_04420 [Methanosarcinaceae archaeon]|nr:hypothetical protein [Methanosarcinaceae archaeon]